MQGEMPADGRPETKAFVPTHPTPGTATLWLVSQTVALVFLLHGTPEFFPSCLPEKPLLISLSQAQARVPVTFVDLQAEIIISPPLIP